MSSSMALDRSSSNSDTFLGTFKYKIIAMNAIKAIDTTKSVLFRLNSGTLEAAWEKFPKDAQRKIRTNFNQQIFFK